MKELDGIRKFLKSINAVIKNGNVYDVWEDEFSAKLTIRVYNAKDGTVRRFPMSYRILLLGPEETKKHILGFVNNHEQLYNSPLYQALL
jgi:hypothetical protein